MKTSYKTLATFSAQGRVLHLAVQTEVVDRLWDRPVGSYVSYVVMDDFAVLSSRETLADAQEHFLFHVNAHLKGA